MNHRRALSLSLVSTALAVPIVVSCSAPGDTVNGPGEAVGGTAGVATTGGAAPGGAGGTSATGGVSGASTTGGAGGATSAGASGAAVTGGSGGTSGTGGSINAGSGGADPAGAAGTGMGGTPGGTGGAAGSGVAGSFVGGGAGGAPTVPTLDCGGKGTALENHGPPANRMNYVIVADGYSETELEPDGQLDQHLAATMKKRFSSIGEPYLRYRNFVNICVLRIASTPICGSSVFGCCGDDTSRLANCNTTAVTNALRDNIPASFEIDLRSVMLNGSSWWNSGGTMMMWSGGNADAGGAALHEGGHGFHSLSDEYGNCELGRVSSEASYGVNVSLTNDMSGGKWDDWIDYDHDPGTGVQGFFGCDGGQTWRPSSNSMMNQLFGDDPDTSYNPVSKEKIVMDFWRVVQAPYDSVIPEAGPVTNPSSLTVNVIDPAVINVDWAVDGNTVALNGGPTYAVGAANLTPGMHTVTARAYDNADTDLVRQVPGTKFNRQYWGAGAMGHSDKTVSWAVTIQ